MTSKLTSVMNQNEIINSLHAEIAKLQGVLELLTGKPAEAKSRGGRPKGSGNQATSFNPEEFAPKKRTLSAEGKARIAAAQKKRWATEKAAAPNRRAAKAVSPAKQARGNSPVKAAQRPATKGLKKAAGKKSPAKTGSRSVTKRASRGAGVSAPEATT